MLRHNSHLVLVKRDVQVTKLTLVLGSNCTTDTRGTTWSWGVCGGRGEKAGEKKAGVCGLIAAT